MCLLLWEALCAGFFRCVSGLTVMLQNATADETSEKFLLRVAICLLQDLEAQQVPFNLPSEAVVLTDAIQVVKDFCKCVVCLLSPIPMYLGSEFAQVEHAARAPASQFIVEELRDALRTSAFWKQKFQTAQKVASADAEFSVLIANAMTQMKGAANVVQEIEAIRAAVGVRADLTSRLRPGALQELETLMTQRLVHVIDSILDSDASGSTGQSLPVDHDWVAQTLGSLPACSADIPDKLLRLSKWKDENLGALTLREMQEIEENGDLASFNVKDVQRLFDILPNPDGNRPLLWRLCHKALQHLAMKAQQVQMM